MKKASDFGASIILRCRCPVTFHGGFAAKETRQCSLKFTSSGADFIIFMFSSYLFSMPLMAHSKLELYFREISISSLSQDGLRSRSPYTNLRFDVSDGLGKAQYAGAQLAQWEAIAAALFGVPVPPGTRGDWLCLFKVVRSC